MIETIKRLFSSSTCKALRIAADEATQLAMNHWGRVEVLTKENESLKDRISDECNAVTLLIDKLEQCKFERIQERKKLADALRDALSLRLLANIRQEINQKTPNATLRRRIEHDQLAIEAIQRVVESISAKDPS
jgi:CRP-like cAMP-binding protein